MTIRHFTLMLIYSVALMISHECEAKPISLGVAEKLNTLREIEHSIASSMRLSPDQWKIIESASHAPEDVVAAVAVLFLQRLDNEQSRKLIQVLEAQELERGLLTAAVLHTGRVERELIQGTVADRVARWTELSRDPNLYIRLQAAKALCSLDTKAAKAVLMLLVDEKSEVSPTANRILTELAVQMRESPPPPYPEIDSDYEWFERSIGSFALPRFASPIEDQQQRDTPPPSIGPKPSLNAPSNKLIAAPSEAPASSTPWSIIVVLIVAATGLLWLLVKNRK